MTCILSVLLPPMTVIFVEFPLSVMQAAAPVLPVRFAVEMIP